MKRTSNGHNAEYLKRQAKKIKRECGIPYNEALNKAATNAGFSGWEHFINQMRREQTVATSTVHGDILPPTPLTLGYKMLFSSKKLHRPNARLPIASHQQIGEMLKVLKRATEKNKRARNAFADVANQLDDWTQLEYKSREELSDEKFFKLYFGEINVPIEYSPSPQRIEELRKLSQQVKAILKGGYHDCKPVRDLLGKMDQGEKWLESWPVSLRIRTNRRRETLVPGGTLVYIKGSKNPVILINHDINAGIVSCYSDSGPRTVSREGITVPRNPLPNKNFKPMRLWLPYGKVINTDGTATLFNRDYVPLWTKLPDGTVLKAAARSQIGDGKKDFFFNDGNAPWAPDRKTVARCMSALREWNVEDQIPQLLELLPVAVAKGDITLL